MSGRARIVGIVLPLIILSTCLGILSYVKYRRAMAHLTAVQLHLRNLEARAEADLFSSLKKAELEQLRGELVQAGDHLTGLKAELGPALALAPYLGWLPVVGADVAAAPDLLELGISMSTAGELIFEGLGPLLDVLEGSTQTPSEVSVGRALAAILADAEPQIAAAKVQLDGVRQRRELMSTGGLSPKVARLLEQLDKYLPFLDSGVQGLLVAPYLLGVDEPRTYLLLAQNNHELRATGGFISGVALLKIDNGQIEELDFRDSYAVDDLTQNHPSAPEPLEKYMLAQLWLVRDANWFADFPTTAQVARDLYQLDQGVLVDGVMAADLEAVALMVAALGSVRLEEYDEEVNAANVMDLMKQYWASPGGEGQTGDWWMHRKDFMGELLGAMMAKLETDPRSLDLAALMDFVSRGLGEKHLLVYVADPTVEEILTENGWDGALRATTGDFLMVVDTNMGFNKVNASVESTVDYDVHIEEDGGLWGEVSVGYRNNSSGQLDHCVQEAAYPPTYPEMMEGCYWNYLRVYVPASARLLQGPEVTLPEGSLRARQNGLAGSALPTDVGPLEAGKNVFADFFVVAPGERRDMVFQYQLPSETLERAGSTTAYRLVVQKQPGTSGIPLRLAVTLPSDAEVLSTSPEPSSLTHAQVVFQSNLLVDREFEVVFR